MQTETSQAKTQPEPADTATAAPATWQDALRQHITGPMFSLAFHIIVLVLLGTLVVVVPAAKKDDVNPVQIAELEPVLPPPEEEPTPAEITAIDTSNPALDRYDSNNLPQMEDVGVTDVQVVSDINIPTSLTIPDSNSALKLRGVLPFGHRGGGGNGLGDGGEGDGHGNLSSELQGVFYDLKQTKDRRPTDDFRGIPTGGWQTGRVAPTLRIMRAFVNGNWRREYDSRGNVHYPELDRFYSAPVRLWTSCFYTADSIDAERAPQDFGCENVDPSAWVCIYSGNVVAPFSGKFRFLGAADDVILVRFNKEIVLDYGWASYSVGTYFHNSFQGGERDLQLLKETSANSTRSKSPLYSKHPLEVYGNNSNPSYNLAKGAVITVKEGEIYPIEILISEMPGGSYHQALYVEQLDANGRPFESNPEYRPLFRTTLALPDRQPSLPYPKFAPYGPVWKVVNSAATAASGTGTATQSLLGNRTTPRSARVNENDDDLSL